MSALCFVVEVEQEYVSHAVCNQSLLMERGGFTNGVRKKGQRGEALLTVHDHAAVALICDDEKSEKVGDRIDAFAEISPEILDLAVQAPAVFALKVRNLKNGRREQLRRCRS